MWFTISSFRVCVLSFCLSLSPLALITSISLQNFSSKSIFLTPATPQVVNALLGHLHLHVTITFTTLKPKPIIPPTQLSQNSTQPFNSIQFPMALITTQPKNPIFNGCTTLHRSIPRRDNTTVLGLGSVKNFNFNRKESKISLKSNPFTYNLAVTAKANAGFGEGLEAESLKHRKILLSEVEVKRERSVFFGRKWSSLDVGTAGIVLAMHVLCLFAPFHFNWPAFWVAVALYVVTGLFGITLSFHRNLSHRSFKLPKWLEYSFAYCGVLALQVDFVSSKRFRSSFSVSSFMLWIFGFVVVMQGNPIDWVSTHRYHHQFCDTERDPHSPTEGFWFSHMSWLFDTNSIIERVCIYSCMYRYHTIASSARPNNLSYRICKLIIRYFMYMQCGEPNNVGDLEKQPFYRFLRSTYLLHPFALGALLYAAGGFPFLVWGMVPKVAFILLSL